MKKKRKPYIPINRNRIAEELRLSDLAKNAGMSDFTLDFRKERNKIMKPENVTAKLIDCDVDSKNDHVTFIFLTPATEKYTPGHKFKKVVPAGSDFKIEDNPSKTYEIHIRILDFFSLLNTSPDEITEQDFKDVLEVANISIWADSPDFQYQGMNYHMSMFNASIYPTDRPPLEWNDKVNQHDNKHNGNQFVGKHVGGLLNQFKFWINPMKNMVVKETKSKGII